jgi:integrase
MAKSSKTFARGKATNPCKKPRPDFPLFPHATGRWAKKIRGKLIYFGKCADDPKGAAALQLWLDQRDDLLAGRTPRTNRDGLSIGEMCNRFLNAKKAKVESGELTETTWRGYRISCEHIVRFFGRSRLVEDVRPTDFQKYRAGLSKRNGVIGLRNQVRNSRMVFLYAYKADLVDRPVKFGPDFTTPSARVIRKAKTPRMFEAYEIRRMLQHANANMKAMVLLAANGGLGNSDVERLPINAIEFKTGWLTYARVKTGTERRIPLWPETVAALRAAIDARPKPASDEVAHRVFLTSRSESYYKQSTRCLTEQFREFLQAVDRLEVEAAKRDKRKAPTPIYRKGVGFYTLRHVFETISGEACDQVATDAIMGHERGDMASI